MVSRLHCFARFKFVEIRSDLNLLSEDTQQILGVSLSKLFQYLLSHKIERSDFHIAPILSFVRPCLLLPCALQLNIHISSYFCISVCDILYRMIKHVYSDMSHKRTKSGAAPLATSCDHPELHLRQKSRLCFEVCLSECLKPRWLLDWVSSQRISLESTSGSISVFAPCLNCPGLSALAVEWLGPDQNCMSKAS